jgi:hypothetical protein
LLGRQQYKKCQQQQEGRQQQSKRQQELNGYRHSINASNSKDVITGGKFATGIDETSGKVRGKEENRNYGFFFPLNRF